jgi:uncharacterized protein YodC (DUF2158 family)
MNEPQWQPGDLVGVKSGGPIMTVARIDAGRVFCEWFDGSGPRKGDFAPVVLEKRLSQNEALASMATKMGRRTRRI